VIYIRDIDALTANTPVDGSCLDPDQIIRISMSKSYRGKYYLYCTTAHNYNDSTSEAAAVQ